jgi:hypothetical protein
MCTPQTQKYGAAPANINWTVIRGDTAVLQVQFYQPDETTSFTTTGWTYTSTVYNPSGEVLDTLDVTGAAGMVTVTAPASITEGWGSGYKSVVSELQFDVQVTIPSGNIAIEDTVWTPVLGYISVLGDVSSGGLS